MLVGEIVVVAAVVLAIAVAVSEGRKRAAEMAEGIYRFATCVLSPDTIRVAGREYPLTRQTSAEVVGSVAEGRRSTATRTAAGAVVAGVPGALVGHAAKKKTNSSSAMLLLNGTDWSETVSVTAKSYGDAVRFAQKVNLAARTSRKKR